MGIVPLTRELTVERDTHTSQIVAGMQRAIPHWRPCLEEGQGRQETGSQKQGLGWYPVWDGSAAAGPGEPLRTQNWVPRRWRWGGGQSYPGESVEEGDAFMLPALQNHPAGSWRSQAWAWGGCGGGGGSGSAMWVGKWSVRGSWEEASGETSRLS